MKQVAKNFMTKVRQKRNGKQPEKLFGVLVGFGEG